MPADSKAAETGARTGQAMAFAIDAAPLARALGNFAKRAGITLSYEPFIVAGKYSRGLRGDYSVEAGLSSLLEGTRIVALPQGKGAYVLRLAEPAGGDRQAGDGNHALPAVSVASARLSDFQVGEASTTTFTAPLLDTPRTVTVVAAEQIRETNAGSLAEVLRGVPGITFKGADSITSPAGDRPVIRGFDATNSLFVDGMRSSGAQGREIFAIEQVEVIEGADAVYNGRGAGGGSINLVSKTPKADNFFLASLSAGSADYARSTLDINRTLGEQTAARLNLMWQDSAKAGRDLVTYHRWGVAPSISFGLNTPSQLTLSYYHLQSNDVPDYSTPYVRGGGAPLMIDRAQFYGLLARDFLRNSNDIAQVEYKLRLGEQLSWRNLTQYARSQQSFIASNPQWAAGAGDVLALQAKTGIFDMTAWSNQSELSGTLDTASVKHKWTAGLVLSRENGRRNGYAVRDSAGNLLGSGGSCAVPYNCTSLSGWNPYSPWTGSAAIEAGLYDADTVTDTASLYLLDTMRVNPSWLLNAGLRYDRYRTRTTGGDVLSNRQGLLNYQVGVVYKPRAEVSLYSSVSTGSNPVGADSGIGSDLISVTNQDLEPERVRNVEAGVKWEPAGRMLALNAAVFRAVKSNARLSIGRDFINGGTQVIRGVTFGVRGNITPAWKIAGGFVYLDSNIADSGTSPAYNGNEFPLTPRKSLALWNSLRLAPGVKLGLGVTYNDRLYANAGNTNFVPAYTKFDAMVSHEVNANLELQLNLYNLTDKRYYDMAYPVYASIAAGRSAVLTARLRF